MKLEIFDSMNTCCESFKLIDGDCDNSIHKESPKIPILSWINPIPCIDTYF